MRMTFEYTEEQYQDYADEIDGLTALEIIGIDWLCVNEPFEDVQQRIADNYRDGNLRVTIEVN